MAILHENEAKKNFFFAKKILKWPTEKKLIFQNRQFSKEIRENFMDWSLGLKFFFRKKKKKFASFSCKMAKVSWLARIGQNFDQAKCDNTF